MSAITIFLSRLLGLYLVATTIGDVVAFKIGPRLDVDHRLDPG